MGRRLRIIYLRMCLNRRRRLALELASIVERRFWTRARSRNFAYDIFLNYDDERMIQNVRMNRAAFNHLVQLATPHMYRQDTILRPAFEVWHRVAAALWYLATHGELRTVAELFGMSPATLDIAVHEFVNVVNLHLFHQVIHLPRNEAEIEVAEQEFNDRRNFPACIGAVDGSHVSIIGPNQDTADYFDRRQRYSVAVKLVAVANGHLLMFLLEQLALCMMRVC